MGCILIVDDQPEVRLHMKKMIAPLGHEIYEAENGIECIKLIKEKEFDLLLLDLRMPGKNGIETLVELKNKKKLKKIIITGVVESDSDTLTEISETLGVDDMLFKPFKKDELISKINCLI